MSEHHQRAEVFEQGGPIIIRAPDGKEIHVVPPLYLGNEVAASDLMPEILQLLTDIYGPVQKEERSEDVELGRMGEWWEWEVHSAPAYAIERRSYVTEIGASGAVEQIIIGLIAAASYDVLKKIASSIVSIVRKRIVEFGLDATKSDIQARIERVLSEHYSVVLPILFNQPRLDGTTRYWNVRDARGTTLVVAIDDDGVMLISFGDTAT